EAVVAEDLRGRGEEHLLLLVDVRAQQRPESGEDALEVDARGLAGELLDLAVERRVLVGEDRERPAVAPHGGLEGGEERALFGLRVDEERLRERADRRRERLDARSGAGQRLEHLELLEEDV